MRILGHRIVVLLGMMLMLAGCGTSPRPSPRGEGGNSPAAERHPFMEGEACRTLENIDSLMWQQPDSAFALLQAFADRPEAASLDGFDGHYFQLLAAELLYKNDCQQTNRKDLLRAVAYFDSLTLSLDDAHRPRRPHRGLDPRSPVRNDDPVFLTARAHYINGAGYYERDSVVEACGEYLKALETMEERFEEKELAGHKARFMALTYTHLTELFSDQYLHEQAIYFAKLSLQHYNKYQALPWHMAWVLDEIGMHYDMMSVHDSANVYYKKSIEALLDTNNLLFRDLTAHQILLSYQTDKDANVALHQLYRLLALSNSDKEYHSRCLSIGDIFFHESQLDSAFRYLSVVYYNSESCDTRKQAAEWLVRICKAQGKDSEAHEFAEFLVPFANLNENNSLLKSQLAELCNEYEQSKQENTWQLHQRNEAVKPNAFVIGGVVLAFFFCSISFLIVYTKRRNVESDKKSKIDAATNPSQVQPFGFATSYADEPICRHLLEVCNDKRKPIKSTVPYSAYSGISLDNAQMAQLKNAAHHHYGILFEKLEKEHPELKDKDYQYCYLCLLGLDNVQIAALLQKSNSTIWDREKRLQKILGCNDKIAIALLGMISIS